MQFETHDVSRHFAAEAAARYHAGPETQTSYVPQSQGYDYILDNAMRMLRTDPTHPTIAHAIDVGQRVGGWQSGGEHVIPLSRSDRDNMAAELVRRFGSAAQFSDGDDPSALATGYYESVRPRPSARLNRLATGQSLMPSLAAPSVRRETAIAGLDVSGVLDTRHPIDPTDTLKIQAMVAATETDLGDLAARGLAASVQANAGFGDLVRGAVDALVAGTNRAMEALAAGALQRTFESQTRISRGAITDNRGRVIAPASEEHSRVREQENFPAHTKLQAGGGTVQVTGVPVREAVFKAAAASLGGRADHYDLSGDPHVVVTDHSAEASCAGNGVAVASAASVEIGAQSATITLSPTIVSRG